MFHVKNTAMMIFRNSFNSTHEMTHIFLPPSCPVVWLLLLANWPHFRFSTTSTGSKAGRINYYIGWKDVRIKTVTINRNPFFPFSSLHLICSSSFFLAFKNYHHHLLKQEVWLLLWRENQWENKRLPTQKIRNVYNFLLYIDWSVDQKLFFSLSQKIAFFNYYLCSTSHFHHRRSQNGQKKAN